MRRRAKAGGEPVKTRSRKTVTLKRRNAPKAMQRRVSTPAGQKPRLARLIREKEIRKLTQMELQTSEERWRSLLENPIFGVTFLDERLRFIRANQTFQTMVGYSDEELRQFTPLDISVAGERETNEALFREMQQGRRQHYEMTKQLRRKDGKLIWVNLYVFAITDRKSGAKLTFGITFDITEKKQAQDALQEMRTELVRVARMNQMIAMTGSIAHEVNQPIAAMVANANAGLRWLQRTPPDIGELRGILETIVRDGHRADDVIKGIRAVFKADPEKHVSLDLNELIREVLVLAEGELQNRPIDVRAELAETLPAVTADRVQLQQVMFNLVTNAIDAMDSVNDRDRILRVKSETDGGSEGVFVTVEDSGSGIAPENFDRIFDTFFTTKPQGLGMGLAICRSIIESHGGRLSAKPARPYGAVFQIALPVGRSNAHNR